jgi:hypothetical protein
MKKLFIVSAFLIFTLQTNMWAQKNLIFEHPASGEVVVVEDGDYLNLEYKGYLKQFQLFKSNVNSISDNSVFFINKESGLPNNVYEIKGEDITGFRRMWKYQPFIKPIASLGVTVGTYFILEDNDLSPGTQLLYSVASGIALNYLIDFLFPEDIKFHISDGWTVRFGVIAETK